MTNESTGQPGTSAQNDAWPAKSTIMIVGVVLVIAAFLAGFLPAHQKGKRLANELSAARQQSQMAELRDLAGLLHLQASQLDYGLAATTSTRFFERTGEVARQIPDAAARKPVEDLLSLRDQITSKLARGEPGVLSDLQALFVQTREATMGTTATPQT